MGIEKLVIPENEKTLEFAVEWQKKKKPQLNHVES